MQWVYTILNAIYGKRYTSSRKPVGFPEDKMTNKEIRRFRVVDIAKEVRDTRLIFYGHVMEEKEPVRDIEQLIKNTRKHLTACQQDVCGLLVPSCCEVWNKLLSSCNKVNEANSLANKLFQQVISSARNKL